MNQSQQEVFEQYEQMVMKTTNVIRKSRFMKSEYNKALSWVSNEIKNPTHTEGFSIEEKVAKLKKSEEDLKEAINLLTTEMNTLKEKVSSLSPLGNIIWEVAEILSDVH
jgi:archaellum component FlaC